MDDGQIIDEEKTQVYTPLANYAAIETTNSRRDGEHDVEGMPKPQHSDESDIFNSAEQKPRRAIVFSSLLILVFVGVISFPITVVYHRAKKNAILPLNASVDITTTTSNAPKNINDETVGGTFQMPFPHVDRAKYGSNPVPASSIVDSSLFSPSILGGQNKNRSSLLKVPFPTGAFWTNLVVKPTDDRLLSYPIMVYPYGYKWNPHFLQVSYPSLRRLMDEISVRDIFNPDLTLNTVEDVAKRQIQSFDPLSVTLRFECSQNMGYWETYLVQGSPYVTAFYKEVTPVIQPISIFKGISCPRNSQNFCKPLNLDQSPPTSIKLQGTQFVITTRENLSWMLFTSKPATLVFDNIRKTSVFTEDPFTGVMRLALIPPPQKETLEYTSKFPGLYDSFLEEGDSSWSSSGIRALVKHSSVYPIGADVSWEFPSKNVANVKFQFKTKSMVSTKKNHQLLMLALPHHTDVLNSPSSQTKCTLLQDEAEFDLNYRTIKGYMTAVVGCTWSYNEELTSIGFDDALENAAKLDAKTRASILDQVAFDVTRVLPALDENVYGYGKQVARLAQLVHIANVLLRTATNNAHFNTSSYTTLIKESTKTLHYFVTAFLSGKNADVLLYDVNFGGLVTENGLLDFMGDFGNGWYNDHHFHYGYHLYASALLGKWNSTFVSEYGSKVDTLMYDVAHSSFTGSDASGATDGAFFPLARHKSWFDGHSFASGLFPFASGKSMESSSESVNCYYGAYLWSTIRHQGSDKKSRTNRDDKLNFARLLLAMEIRGVKTYWHMNPENTGNTDSDTRLYNPTFAKNLMVGNLGMMDVTVSTWFGRNPLYVHMINFVPITGITRELFDKKYVKKEFPGAIEPIYDSVEMAWKGYVICDRAMLDPNAAWYDALELRSYELDQAISKSQVLYFISTTDGFKQPENSKRGQDGESEISDASSPYCYDHSGCAALSLTGLCCPTAAGTNLGCCDSTSKFDTQSKGAGGDKETASCSDHEGCAAQGLTGLCCPTSDGTNLGCCDDSANTSKSNENREEEEGPHTQETAFGSCSDHELCAALGLTGLCCPTIAGTRLGCCDGLKQLNW